MFRGRGGGTSREGKSEDLKETGDYTLCNQVGGHTKWNHELRYQFGLSKDKGQFLPRKEVHKGLISIHRDFRGGKEEN